MSPTGTAPSARYGHTAVMTAAGDGFFVFGGKQTYSGGLDRCCVISRCLGAWGVSSLLGRQGRVGDFHFYSVEVGENGIEINESVNCMPWLFT